MKQHIFHITQYHPLSLAARTIRIVMALSVLLFFSCQKRLDLKYDLAPVKQVIIANAYPDILYVNISKSKQPDDFRPIEFLDNCIVTLYEDGIYREQLQFFLKDTLSGLGYYRTATALSPGKSYRIVSQHPELGTAETTEYLPEYPALSKVELLQHADSVQTSSTGRYTFTLQDDGNRKDYYFVAAFYKVLRPVLQEDGDTVYRYDYIYNSPSYAPPVFTNPENYFRSYFTDELLNGKTMTIPCTFPSQYYGEFRESYLIIEIVAVGENYYKWYVSQLPKGIPYLNDGQFQRMNTPNNIVNGFGHFTANSSMYYTFRIH
jgi:hypothetical protein